MIPALGRWLGRPQPADVVELAGPELRAQVRRLEIRARQSMETGLAGRYQSAFKGRGLEFEEVREYRPGDDVRTLDWNVTARTGQLHVKQYREERDLTVLLLVDLSASTRSGSGVMTVHDLIAESASLFALAASKRDRVGAVLFDERVRTLIPPRLGWRHGLRIVREVLGSVPAGHGTAVDEAVAAAARLLTRRGVVILVTDRECPLPRRPLAALAGRHDVVVVRVADRLTEGAAPMPELPVVDVESGRTQVLSGRVRRGDEERIAGVDVITLTTGEEYLPAVQALFELKERRRAN